MSIATLRPGSQGFCDDGSREPLVIGRFQHDEQAAGAVEELREHWGTDEGSIFGKDISSREVANGILTGMAIAVPIASLATLDLLDLLTDLWGYGYGSLSLTWMLSGLVIGACLDVVIGAFGGLHQTVRTTEARLREIPLGQDDTLVVAMAGEDADEARDVMVQHEGCHVTEL